jgi:hypothetical protein
MLLSLQKNYLYEPFDTTCDYDIDGNAQPTS